MINAKFLPISVNADDDARVLQETEVLNIENMRVGVSEDGKAFQIRNFPSTQLLYSVTVPYNNLCIGNTKDLSRQRIFGFIWNDYGLHQIIAYDIPLNISYIVLLSSQTSKGFDFDRYSRIDKNARVIGDLLIWTDNLNEPQCINIEAGIKLNQPSYVTDTEPYAVNIPYETLTLIKRPPIFRPQATKMYDSGFNNNYIKNNAYQFTISYQYKNNQYSALSTYSQLMPYNASGNLFNYISIAMSFSETIPDYVQQVDFCVKYGNYGKTFIIRSYNKAYYYDLIAIASHNAGVVQLGFAFYDNFTDIALNDIAANTPFHLVPLTSFSVEVANNRVFLGNNLSGYDTPQKTSLSTSLTTINTGASGSYAGTWGYITLHANLDGGCQDTFMFPFINSGTSPSPFYYASSVRNSTIWNGGVGSVPSTINLSDCVGFASEASLVDYLKATQYPSGSGCAILSPPWDAGYNISAYNALGNTTIINYVSTGASQFFKSNSTYYVTIAFFDRFRRKCGVNRNVIKVVIPQRTYSQTVFNAAIQWALSNSDALNEIPIWAYYYQIHISKNTTTRFFAQIAVENSDYVLKLQDGNYDYGNSTFSETTYAIGFDLSQLTGVGLGYIFTEGDYAVVYMSGASYTVRVLGQNGNFVLLEPRDIGTLDASTDAIIELYTPYKPSTTEPYYETGEVMTISSPATSGRSYSVLSGTINGDCYGVERTKPDTTLYIVEAMSPNDSIWFVWQTDTGWENVIDDIGQQQKPTSIIWSDTYINGTKTNGLNVFQPLNQKDIGATSGQIQKLQLTNKQQEDGTVLLIITETDHLSAYLQEVQLLKAAGNSDIITTDQVIGTINALKNGKGTINPETVEEFQGVVWGWSIINGSAWQYANDGVTDVSDYKMKRVIDRYCKRYLAQGYNSAYNPIHGCYDPSSDEMLFNLPAVEDAGFPPVLPSYSGVIPDYATSIQNRFDIYDGQQKILIFKPQLNKWVGAYKYNPDCMMNLGSKLFGFNTANLWLFNEDFTSWNTVFGVECPARVCLPVNIGDPSLIKDIMNIALEGNGVVPNYTVMYSEYPFVQITDLADTDTNADGSLKWENNEGVISASFFKDRLSPNVIGTVVKKMLEGDFINSATPLLMIEWQQYDSQLIVNFVNIGILVSKGQLGLLNQKVNERTQFIK